MRKVRKAVFPVAGLGTRFLPATKAIPKEMLTVVDRPVIQYVVDEAREAGIEHFIFVTGRNKAVIEDHFDIQFELYDTLAQRGKTDQLDRLRALQPAPGQTSFTRQQEPRGLGHAVWCARELVGDGFEITAMVEKPARGTAPSNLYINGRYILQPEIFAILENQERGAGGEIQLTDAMIRLGETQKMFGFHYRGDTYDCGSPEGFVEANLAFALRRDDLREVVESVMARLAGTSRE